MSKVKNSLKANGEDLVNEYVVMSMNNLLEYSDNYSRTLRNLRNCYRGEIDNVDNDALGVKSFKLKTKIIRKTPAQTLWPAQAPLNPDGTQTLLSQQPPIPRSNTEVTTPLKYLSNFKRSPNLPLIKSLIWDGQENMDF